MGWEFPSNTNIASDKPVRASDIRKIRDLVPALAAGDVGAPRIAPDALEVPPVGSNDTYQDFTGSRSVGVSYQNPTGQAIEVFAVIGDGGSGADRTGFQISTDGTNWLTLLDSSNGKSLTVTVGKNEYVRVIQLNGSGARIVSWFERRP